MAGAGVISCPGCGASYPWKPQLAGKKVRCKCGKLFAAEAPKALPAEPAEEPDIFAFDEDIDVRAIPEPQHLAALPPAFQPPRKTATIAPPRAAAAPAATGAPSMASAYPTRGRGRTVAQEEDTSESRKKVIVPLAILVLVIGGGIFAVLGLKGGALGKKKVMLGEDAKIVEMIEDEGGTEVKEWIKAHNRHMIHNMTEGQVVAFADRLYSMGAVKVYAFGEMISASLAVELPTDPEKRKKLWEFEKEHNGFRSKQKDVGQQYFLLYMFF